MNFIGCSRLHFLLVLLQCLNMAMVGVLALCTSASFSRSIGYILRGFLLGEFEVGNIMECKERCIISVNCLSLNVLTTSNGGFVCQLNNGRKEDGADEQFVQHVAGQYYGLNVSIRLKQTFLFHESNDWFLVREGEPNSKPHSKAGYVSTLISMEGVRQIT